MGAVYEEDDLRAVAEIMQAAVQPGGSFFPLPEETNFQEALGTHEGARKAIAVNSCGTALDLCMMALEVGPGDEVITTPLTFVCTAGCAVARGARVVFADVDPGTLCLDPMMSCVVSLPEPDTRASTIGSRRHRRRSSRSISLAWPPTALASTRLHKSPESLLSTMRPMPSRQSTTVDGTVKLTDLVPNQRLGKSLSC